MKHLSTLLDNFQKRFTPPQASVEKRVAEIICEVTTLQIKPEQIKYTVSTKTISLQVPSVLKSELQHQKTFILERLKSDMGVNAPKVIL